MRINATREFFVGVCLFFSLAVPALPQTSAGSVRGTVRDQSGGVIPGAEVTLTNVGTGVATQTVTNESGFYVFPALTPGSYRIVIDSPGMKKFEGSLTIQVQQVATVDPVLGIAGAATEIVVSDVTPVVNLDNPTLGHVLERQRIDQLPINGRSIQSLLVTVPGMEGNRAYGLREGSHEYVIDGAALSDKLWGGIVRRPPGLDTIEEFKVENNNSSAKFTRPTTVVMSTRSGTNQFHGSLFETHRNNALGKARRREEYFNKPPQLIRNEYGASAGGPLIIPGLYHGRNRTFWFAAYEGSRNINPQTQRYPVPTPEMRNGDFRGLIDSQGRLLRIFDPFTTDAASWQRQQVSYQGQLNVIDPARISPLAKYLFSITPLPTEPGVNPLLDSNWVGPTPNTRREWTLTTRFDHRFSDRDQVYGRYTQGDFWSFAQKFTLPMLNNVAGTVRRLAPMRNLAISWVRTVSPSMTNELLISGAREKWFMGTGEPGVKYADELGLPNPLNVAGWPGLYDTGLGNYYFETDNTQASGLNYFIIDNNATKVWRKHELQFGFHFRYDQLNVLPDQQQNQGNHSWSTLASALYDSSTSRTNPLAVPQTGHNLANMFFGVMNYSNQFVRGYFYMRSKEYSLYFQDNYRLTPRLTLNLGLRWEFWPAFREKNSILTTFDPDKRAVVLGTPLSEMYRFGATLRPIVDRLTTMGAKFISASEAGLPDSLMYSNARDFGPRLGFAYRALDGASAFVIRGGYRISYFPIPMRPWTARMRSNAPLTARFRTSQTDPALSPDGIQNYGLRTVPTVISGKNSRDAVTLGAAQLPRGVTASYFAREQPDPRVHDWNFTLEKEVFSNTVARVAYVGNHGARLEQFYHFNDAPPDYIWFTTTGLPLPTGEFAPVARRPYDQQVYGLVEEYRKTGWSNYNGFQFEFERRYAKGYGFQVFYNVNNLLAAGGQEWSGTSVIPDVNQFLPGKVPADLDARNRLLNYQRDISIPKHRVRWNWIMDLPFGQGKFIGRDVNGFVDRLIGGWQIAGIGSLRSNYFALPTSIYPTGTNVELYGYKYPIQDCRSGACRPGYLWWNGYIPSNRINSNDPVTGRPNGVMGVPESYRAAAQPLIPAGSTTLPANAPANTNLQQFWDTNTVWVPLKNGTAQRTTYNDNLHPWRQQYMPGVRQWGVDASLFKTVSINETVKLRINADFFNVFNMPGNPNSIGSDGILSTRNSGQNSRELQLTLRLSW